MKVKSVLKMIDSETWVCIVTDLKQHEDVAVQFGEPDYLLANAGGLLRKKVKRIGADNEKAIALYI